MLLDFMKIIHVGAKNHGTQNLSLVPSWVSVSGSDNDVAMQEHCCLGNVALIWNKEKSLVRGSQSGEFIKQGRVM